MAFIRQAWTLSSKNLKIVIVRHGLATVLRAFILPLAITIFLSFAKNIFVPQATFGVGTPSPVKPLSEGLDLGAGTGRETVVFVNSGFQGGAIDRVIDRLADTVTSAGKTAQRASDQSRLTRMCKSSLRGVTDCYGAVVFHSSPDEGGSSIWNYTIRVDGALGGGKIDVDKSTNDGETFVLPLQHAVDKEISSIITTDNRQALTDNTYEYPFTTMTPEERATQIRSAYQSVLTNWLGVAFFLGFIGIAYHQVGFMATEREVGMSTLIEAMMPTRFRWQPQAARLFSYWSAFTLVYLPGWVIGSIILGRGVFATTNVGMVLVYHIMSGLALASMSILGAAFFRKSQLSGVLVTIVLILLAIIAQVISYPSTAQVVILSLLFTPCNYVYFIHFLARFEKQRLAADLAKNPPDSPWGLPGLALWIFLILQIFTYPLIGAYIERALHGTTSQSRTILRGQDAQAMDSAVRLEGFTKIYKSGVLRNAFSFIRKPREPVRAVDGLTLKADRGQILALLGANGSGKSTTLDAVAGINKVTSGQITIDGTGGIGIAPQKNVLWDELTVEEHIRYFNRLKSPGNRAPQGEIRQLIASVDLELKRQAISKTLSGGQKRKLQLGMMLTGGSAVCCVDEVSSGIDPLSRRKIWDILLAERGRRTIILTTHFLDEADLLADHIAILSKGTLRAEGSSVELKDRSGSGYRIHVHNARSFASTPDVEGVTKKVHFDVITYLAPSSSLAATVIKTLESEGIHDYKFSGPTIEDVFLQTSEEIKDEENALRLQQARNLPTGDKQASPEEVVVSEDTNKEGLELLSGVRIGRLKQTGVLFRKRCTVFKNNWVPYVLAFLIPIVAAGLVTLFVHGQEPAGCSPEQQFASVTVSLADEPSFFFVAGPSSKIDQDTLTRLFLPILQTQFGDKLGDMMGDGGSAGGLSGLQDSFRLVDTYDDFQNTIIQERKNVTPGGVWLGDAETNPTMAYAANPAPADIYYPLLTQNYMNVLLTNQTIAANWQPFDVPWSADTGDSLQLLVYLCLALAAFPGFFALYPNIERRRNVRGLQYSNGVRTLPLWTAYLAFDFAIVLISTAIVTAILAAASSVWYHVGFLFLIFMLYGLDSILLSYVISLFCGTQLSAYAFVAAGQTVMFLAYLVAYLCTNTYAPVNKVDDYLSLVNFLVSAFAPIGNVVRSLFLALNLFSATCDDEVLNSNPGSIWVYGQPILYLLVQSVILFALLLWLDSGNVQNFFNRFRRAAPAPTDPEISDEDVANELARVASSAGQGTDGLKVDHLTKTFSKNTAVDNVTFGIKRGEVFALLGPNGAGKSTTISLIRGDIKPSRNGGDVFVEDISVTQRLAEARANLGVCPQFDAVDQMTVREHLVFYARVRGIPDIEHNVRAVLTAVGLSSFSERQAYALSGGNKRKLSLGIALMGNPAVLLLDEPSSGLDAAAKRIMWRTLAATAAGRSILLTTHSMEEADALAGRAGILARRMLAMGPVESLRQRFGDALHVHLVCRGAPRTAPGTTTGIRAWVLREFPGADVEDNTYHGQMRFSIPAESVLKRTGAAAAAGGEQGDQQRRSPIGQLVVMLEETKQELGIEHYSVSPTTLDQVFLTIVGQHNVQEENYEEKKDKKGKWWKK